MAMSHKFNGETRTVLGALSPNIRTLPKNPKHKEIFQPSKKKAPKLKIAATLLFLLFLASPIAYSLVSYSANITITPLNRPFAIASIDYRSNTGINFLNSPKERTWNGSAWSSPETEMDTAGSSVLWVRAVYCSLQSRSSEKIVVTLSTDDYLDAYVWNGSSWKTTNNIGQVNSGASPYQSFDIAYEGASGKAMLVYALASSDGTKDLAYKTWDGTTWSSETYINDVGHSGSINYRWVELESNPTIGSNEIALIAIDQTDADSNGWIWNGTAWGNFQELENSLSAVRDNEFMGVAYEHQSGQAMFVWSYSGFLESRKWNGTGWENEQPAINISTLNVRWVSLKADPSSNYLMATTIDGQSHLNTIFWNGSSWASPVVHDVGVTHTDRRCADFDWEPLGSKGLIVWSAVQNSVSYKTFTASAAWSNISTASNPSTHPWIQLKSNPKYVLGDVKILGATLNGNQDIFGIRWDGSVLTIESNAFTSDTSTIAYECFDIAFQLGNS